MMIILWFLFISSASAQVPENILVDGFKKGKTQSERVEINLKPAQKPYRICVSLPNVMDQYWTSVSYGIYLAQNHFKVDLLIEDAGGYSNLGVQAKVLERCRVLKADAVVVAAISSKGLNTEIARLKKDGIPVIDMINGIESEDVSAHSVVSFEDLMDLLLKRYRQSHSLPHFQKISILPGPRGAGWVEQAVKGIRKHVPYPDERIKYGGTDLLEQRELVDRTIEEKPKLILANAVAAEILAQNYRLKRKDAPDLLSIYFNPSLLTHVRTKVIPFTITEFPIKQAILAIDAAIRVIEKRQVYFKVSPIPEIIHSENFDNLSLIMPPKNYRFLIKKNFTN